jgi:hypothetical protein
MGKMVEHLVEILGTEWEVLSWMEDVFGCLLGIVGMGFRGRVIGLFHR